MIQLRSRASVYEVVGSNPVVWWFYISNLTGGKVRATIAQRINLPYVTCRPRFESQSHNLSFNHELINIGTTISFLHLSFNFENEHKMENKQNLAKVSHNHRTRGKVIRNVSKHPGWKVKTDTNCRASLWRTAPMQWPTKCDAPFQNASFVWHEMRSYLIEFELTWPELIRINPT